MLGKTFRRGSTWMIILVALSVLATTAHGQNSKKKKKPAPPAGQEGAVTAAEARQQKARALNRVQSKLDAYATAEAREQLMPVLDESKAADLVVFGRLLGQEKKYEAAAARLRQAAELSPGDPEPWLQLGETQLHAGLEEDAKTAFREAVRLAEAKATAAQERATAEPTERNQNAQAAALLELGWAQQRLERYGPAAVNLQKARDLAPGHIGVAYQLGVTRLALQEYGTAVDLLTEVVNSESGMAYAYYYRALAAGKTADRKDLLINDLDRFLAVAPEAPEAPRARALLQRLRR